MKLVTLLVKVEGAKHMSSNDYFRFVTQELVKKMDAPKQEKKQKEKEKHQLHGKWFGVLPFAFKLFFRSRKK